jgi:hypothetical protein
MNGVLFTANTKIFWTNEGSIESRSVELSQSIECYTEASAVPSISTLSSTFHGWSHFARLVILAVGVPTWKLAWNFSAQQVQAEL